LYSFYRGLNVILSTISQKYGKKRGGARKIINFFIKSDEKINLFDKILFLNNA
jgi:hypothetical protein